MFDKDYYSGLYLSHPFGEIRSYGRHVGRDISSAENKAQRAYQNIAGVIDDIDKHRDHGLYVTVKHNPKYAGKIDDLLYSRHKHLSSVRDSILQDHLKGINQFIEAGTVIGNFGNTGYCLTRDESGWRRLTDKEIADVNEIRGVHGHEEHFQICSKGEDTPLLKELLRLYPNEMILNMGYIYQWGKVYYNADIIFKYLTKDN